MPFLTDGVPALALFTGKESFPIDTYANSGGQPQQSLVAMYKLALLLTSMMNSLDKTMVAGTIYYTQFNIGETYTPVPRGAVISDFSFLSTGVNIAVGTPGGTDTWHAGIWNSAGVLVGRTATAGVTAGTALTIQQLPWAGSSGAATGVDAPVTLTSGVYYIGLQSNGTTAKFKSVNSPIWPFATGSQTGTAATLPAISAIATTFTANLGPIASLY